MALPKGQSNSGIKNLYPHIYKKGQSGYHFRKISKICKICGKPYDTRGPSSKYCSASCKEKSRPDSQKKDFICEFCKKPFRRRAPNNAGKFCSRQCSGLHATATGKKNYFYKAFLYLPHKCDICGNDDYEVLLVRHRDNNRKNNSLGNLQILCANCHYRIRFGRGKTRKMKLVPIINFLSRIPNAIG